MAKVYRLAMARASEVETPIEPAAVNRLIDAVETDSEITLSDEERQTLYPQRDNWLRNWNACKERAAMVYGTLSSAIVIAPDLQGNSLTALFPIRRGWQ